MDLGNLEATPCDIDLPEKNAFIPQDLTILPLGENPFPVLLAEYKDHKNVQPYYKKDHRFSLPKAELNLRLYFNGSNSVKEDVCRKLFEQMTKQHLREFAYMAEVAELNSEVSYGNYYTLNIKVNGFRDSFQTFVTQYLEKILTYELNGPNDANLFENIKEKQIKNYANQLLGNPYQLAYESIVTALRDGSSQPTQKKLEIAPSINFADVQAYAAQWKKKIYTELLISGNLDEALAVKVTQTIESITKKFSASLEVDKISEIKPVILPQNQINIVEEVLSSKDETNCSIIVHYQHK